MFEINLSNARQWSRIGSRGVFGQAILAVAEHYPDMMVMSADLGNSSGLDRFKKTYPNQFLNIGIADIDFVILIVVVCQFVKFDSFLLYLHSIQ